MKSKIAGVALAAILGTCAFDGGAHQALAGAWADDISVQYDYGPYIIGQHASFVINVNRQELGNYDFSFNAFAVDPGYSDFSYSTSGSVYDTFDPNSSDYAYIRTPFFNYSVFFPNGIYGSGTAFINYGFNNSGFGQGGDNSLRFYDAPGLGLGLVPLPSAAPMFGVALLILGAASYARCRMKVLSNHAVKAA